MIENEDGVLDCVGFFDHIGHDEAPQVRMTYTLAVLRPDDWPVCRAHA